MKKRLLMAMVAAMMISAAGCSMDADSLTAENAGEKAKEVLDTTKTEFEDVLDVKVPTIKPEDMEKVKDVIDTGKDVVSDIASKAGVAAEGLKDTEIKLPEDASLNQLSAIASAKSYLETMNFSKQGLIDQLSSDFADKFSLEDAKYAVEFIESTGIIDWGKQAIGSAAQYLETSAFSKQALIDQLKSENGEKFTEEQAAQAVEYLETNSMVDWNEQAVKAAKQYMEISSFSKEELIEQLTSEYGGRFTAEQAEYAVSQLVFE